MTLPGAEAPLRHHQRAALAALDAGWAVGRTRAWVELPPGAGKTRIGVVTAATMLREGTVTRVVALAPNTAIQGQWEAHGRAFALSTGTDRVLGEQLTALTYQALAVFEPGTGEEPTAQIARLHDNGRALVEQLRGAGRVLLILDECHHLLEVWGRLLGEVLDLLPEARVLGLTATPPTSMTQAQSRLVDELFGGIAFAASIPAVVREGDLAPYLDLAWLVRPNAREADWLAESAQRFTELTTALLEPTYGTTAFLPWLDARALDPDGWRRLLLEEPAQADAVLRFHHAGLVALPPGARPAEQHRRDPTADDWAALLEDWLLACVVPSPRPEDAALVEAVRRALPAIGFTWTVRGLRRGRTPVDRVLARSAAKTIAAVGIVDAEQLNLGTRLRLLVLCDYERASATLPADLDGVIEQQTGSAYDVLAALLADPETMAVPTLMVTAQTVAGDEPTLRALREQVLADAPGTVLAVTPPDAAGICRLEGSWTSRTWVRAATAFFEKGRARVLVGTRALLGEGWDARTVTGLVDLTTVTTSTAVVQTRGRALRTDPADPDKVAINWSVVCVAPEHPRGDRDWQRLVAKHQGYFGPDADGSIVDGVAHLDDGFSPFAPPDADDFDAINARMVVRGQDRDTIRERWRVGTPYADVVVHTLRVHLGDEAPSAVADGAAPAAYVDTGQLVDRTGTLLRRGRPGDWWREGLTGSGLTGLVAAVGLVASPPLAATVGVVGLLATGGVVGARQWRLVRSGRRAWQEAGRGPSVQRIAWAIADTLRAQGQAAYGADHVELTRDADGVLRCWLREVSAEESERFAVAMDDALAPLGDTGWLIGTPLTPEHRPTLGQAEAAGFGSAPTGLTLWHNVPTGLRRAELRTHWQRWVGAGTLVSASSPAGAEIRSGPDARPRATAVLRRQWS